MHYILHVFQFFHRHIWNCCCACLYVGNGRASGIEVQRANRSRVTVIRYLQNEKNDPSGTSYRMTISWTMDQPRVSGISDQRILLPKTALQWAIDKIRQHLQQVDVELLPLQRPQLVLMLCWWQREHWNQRNHCSLMMLCWSQNRP